VVLWKLMPFALSMPSPRQLQEVNDKLQQTNTRIEHEVTKRTEELQEAEKKLYQSQKMEAIGNLTGGMAHDFNNLLAIIVANLDYRRKRVKDSPESKALTQAPMEADLRGADLTRRLLACARQKPLQPQMTNLNELVDGMSKLFIRTLGEDVQ